MKLPLVDNQTLTNVLKKIKLAKIPFYGNWRDLYDLRETVKMSVALMMGGPVGFFYM